MLTVQFLGPFLEGGALPRPAVGDEIEAAPALFVATTSPVAAPALPGWWTDEVGMVEARGTVLTSLPGAGTTGPVSVLDTGDVLFPMYWADTTPAEGPAAVGGALYLDPDLAPGTEYGELVALCRERFRVTAVRRAARSHWRREPPRELPAVPDRVTPDEVVVADLLPLRRPGTQRDEEAG